MDKKINITIAKIVILFCIVAVAIVSSLIIYQEKKFYEEKVQASSKETQRMVNVLSDYIEVSFFLFDTLLKRFYYEQVIDKLAKSQYGENVIGKIYFLQKFPYMEAVYIANAHGKITHAFYNNDKLRNVMDINDSVRDESYFQHHYLVNNHQINLQYFQKDQPDRQLMLFSRRLNQNNVFQGVAFAIVNNEYIDKFMRSASVAGKQNEIALMLDNNEILFSSSRIKQDIDEVKKMTGQFQNHTHSKEIITFNKFDNDSLRVFAAKQFEYLPISLAIASYENDITTDFFASEESILLFLVSSIIIAAIVLFLALTIKKRLESNQEWLKFGLLANHHKYMLIQEMIGNFKIPLNAIAGFCDILAAEYLGKLSAQQKAHIKDIYQCSTELNNEIEKILYLCDKNHKSFELNNHYTTIGDLFNDTLHYVKQQINTERVQLTFQENMPFVLYIDNVKLAQALANILVKAIYYTPIGNKIQVNYHYDTRNKPLADLNSNIAFIGGFEQIPDQDHNSDANKSASEQEHYADIIIEIINEGMIITEKKLEQEIETFRNLSNDDSIKDFTNSLLLAKVFVELHNGKFEIRNNEDKGTIFSITIPATRVYNDDYHKKIPKPKII